MALQKKKAKGTKAIDENQMDRGMGRELKEGSFSVGDARSEGQRAVKGRIEAKRSGVTASEATEVRESAGGGMRLKRARPGYPLDGKLVYEAVFHRTKGKKTRTLSPRQREGPSQDWEKLTASGCRCV